MQRVQRKFGTFLKRSEDEADVGVILKEFEDTEHFLTSFIAHGESFLQAWRGILRNQLSVAESFHFLYQPIATDEGVEHMSAAKSDDAVVKASRLESTYAEVNADLAEEVVSIETRLLKPAIQARDDLKPLKKVIKKREDRKLDYERYHSRVESASRKETRSAKEDAALMKHESDLAVATQEYTAADDQIKRAFPPLLDAIARLVPHLLSTQIMIQHALVAQLYTAVYGFCQQQGMAVSSPPLEEVVSVWDHSFTPLRNEVESGLNVIASGKAVHQPMELQEKQQGSVTGLGLRNALAERKKGSHGSLPKPSVPSFFSRKESAAHVEEEEEEAPPARPPRPNMGHVSHAYDEEEEAPPMKPPRPTMGHVSHPHDEEEEAPPQKPPRPGAPSLGNMRISSPGRLTPGSSSPGTPYENALAGHHAAQTAGSPHRHGSGQLDSPYLTPQGGSLTPSRASPGNDYFNRERKPSTASTASAASVAAKKKPPPPVPAKRVPSAQSQYVTALYDFTGQNEGDLSFVEGDRIRVVKKTESTNDWWKGEIRGTVGSFPANYVQ